MSTETEQKPTFKVYHDRDDEPTFISASDDTANAVELGTTLPAEYRRQLAKDIAIILNGDMRMAWKLTIERLYGDYEQGGEQSTPGYIDIFYCPTKEARDQALAAAKPIVEKLSKIIGDEVIVYDGTDENYPVLIPTDHKIEDGFSRELLRDMTEGAGEEWDAIVAEMDGGTA